MKLALFIKENHISNPVDSDRCIVVDISTCCKPIKVMKLASGADGVARISQIAIKLSSIGINGVVLSKLGVEGFKALKDLGLKIYRFNGSISEFEKMVNTKGLDLEEINTQDKVDFNCPCCSGRSIKN